MKISIATPSKNGELKQYTSNSITRLCLKCHIEGIETVLQNVFDRTESARNQLVTLAQEAGCSHILFIDSDALFPPDAAIRLLEAKKKIIGCNAAMKHTGEPVVKFKLDGTPINYILDDIVEVDFIGMHVTLIETEFLKEIRKPWFYARPKPGQERVFSEDVTFCRDMRDGFGVSTFCHVPLSIEIGHIDGRENVVYLEKHIRKQMEEHGNRTKNS
jgi:choline kinase